MEPERFTEYGIRVTLPGHSPRITPCATFVRDAIRAYDHAAMLHGEDAVEFLSRQVVRTDWVAGKLPPALDEPPDCEPAWERPSLSAPVFVDVHLPEPREETKDA